MYNQHKYLYNAYKLSFQTSKRDHLEKVKIYFCNFSNALQVKDPVRKARYINTTTRATFRAIFLRLLLLLMKITNVKFKTAPNSRSPKESQLILRILKC